MHLFETALFKDIDIIEEYGIHIKQYERGNLIFPDEITEMGIVLSGCMKVYKNDLSGGINIVEYIEPGELIYESSEPSAKSVLNVTYICGKKTEVAYFNCKNILKDPELAGRLVNMLSSGKMRLRERMSVMCGRSIRDKLKCYFEIASARKGEKSFSMPITMGELANLLSIDRSAMSREIKKMKEEKLIKIEKHIVTIYWETDF